MDAKRTSGAVWSILLLVCGGCAALDGPSPTARPKEDSTAQAPEPPQVVQSPAPADSDETTDGLANSVSRFIESVETAAQRRALRERGDSTGAVYQHAADQRFQRMPAPQTQPAESAPAVSAIPAAEDANQSSATQPAGTAIPAAPPAVTAVVIRSAPGFETAPPDDVTPGVNAAAVARRAPLSLREFLDQVPPPEQASFREQLDLRVLRVLAGQYEEARAPLSLVTAEQQELAGRFIEALIAIRESHAGDLAAAASAAGQELARLQEALRKLSDLSVPVVRICSSVRSYGQYDVIDPPRFVAGGAEFVLYCEVRDFVSEQRDDGFYYTRFDLTTTLLSHSGDVVLELKDTDITDRCRNLRHDCFIPRLVRLPASLSPGQYVAKVTVVDKLGQKVAENRATFQIVARP
jgi:hypothetical protein